MVAANPGLAFLPILWDLPVDLKFSIVLGETVYNLRAALDYLVYELAIEDSGRIQEDTEFLIEYTEDGFTRRRESCLRGLSDEHVAAIKRLQPCRGCEWTKRLKGISNPDKHRKLTSVASVGGGSFQTKIDRKGSFSGVLVPGPGFFPPGSVPGMVTAIYPTPGDPSREMYMQFSVTVPVTLEDGSPVINTVEQLQTEVGKTLRDFEPEFK